MYPVHAMCGGPGAKHQPEQVHADVDTYINKFDGHKTPWALFQPQAGKRQFRQAVERQNQGKPADVFRVLRILKHIGHRLRKHQ